MFQSTLIKEWSSYSGTVRDDEGNIVSTNVKEDPDADPDADSDEGDTEGKEGKGGTGGKGDLSESNLKLFTLIYFQCLKKH